MNIRQLTYTTLMTAIIAIACVSCGGATTQGSEATTGGGSGAVGDFTLRDIDGNNLTFSQLAHQNVAVITFWAPCCESSRQIMVDAQKIHDRFKNQGVVYFGIALDEPDTRNQVKSFIRQRDLSFPVLLDEEGDVGARLNSRRVLPYTVVVDKNGDVSWTHEGYAPGDDVLIDAAVRNAL